MYSKSRYESTIQQVTHKGGESAINYIKRFQNAHDFSVLVGNSHSEDQLMHTFLKVMGPGSLPVHVFLFFSENSVGCVSSSKPVGRVSISESVGRASISESIGRVSGLLSVGRVS